MIDKTRMLNDEMTTTTETIQQDSIKLIKNTKGFNYEIKFHNNDHNELLKEIERVNKILEEKYGKED